MRPVHRGPLLHPVLLLALALTAGALPSPAEPAPPPADPPPAALEPAARQLAADLEQAGAGSVAVVEFTDLAGRSSELGRYLADRVSAALAAAGARDGGTGDRLRVIDRLRLAEILAERNLSGTGLLDPESGARAARIAGVEALVTGRITSFEDAVRVSLLALRAGSAEVVASAAAEVPRIPTIAELERRSLELPCDPGEGAPGAGGTLPAGPPLQRVEKRHFELSLHGCSRRDGEVRCAMVAVNRRDDERNLLLEGSSRVVLGDGRAVRARRVSAGGWWATGPLSRVGAEMLSGVPVVVGAVFAGVPEGAERIELLVFDFYGLEAEFREVPIGR